MSVIGTHRRRREAVYQTVRRRSEEGWEGDLLHLCGSIALMATVIGIRVLWYLHHG